MKQQRCIFLVAIAGLSLVLSFVGTYVYQSYIKKNSYIIDTSKLEELKSRAQETNSDAIIIWHNDNTIFKWASADAPATFGIMSITKSIVSLIIAFLVQEKILSSLDIPIYTFYPEWKQGNKQYITLKHIMNHTSGIQEKSDAFKEIIPAPDAIKLALAAELMTQPGETFFYNNKATNLLAGIIQRLTNKPLDEYAREKLFTPIGIENICWQKDQAGNPYVMAGINMNADDLLKIGKLILHHGTWNGTQLLEKKWLDCILNQSQPYIENLGLLWWLLKDEDDVKRPTVGFYAQGYLGQYLVIIPSKNIIAVRLVRYNEKYDKEYIRKISFEDFPQLINQMIKRM